MIYYFLITFIIAIKFNLCNEIKDIKYIKEGFYSKYPDSNENNYFHQRCINNYLFINLKVGSNEQNVEMKIDLNLYETYIVKEGIVNKNIYKPYDINSSIHFNTSKRFYSQITEFSTALLAKDSITINNGETNIKLNPFYFAYVDDGFNKLAGSIGFNLLKTYLYPEESMNFIDQLKNNSIISGYSLTIKFTSKYKGYLLIGPDIEEINPSEIENYNRHVIKASGYGMINNGKWEIDLNRVLVGDSELFYSKKIRFNFQYDFIIGTDEYTEFISRNFFAVLFGLDKCIKEELSSFQYYVGIKCKKGTDLRNFPDLVFDISSDFEKFKLVLDYEDLFEEIGEYIYFKIILTSNEESDISINKEWILGKEFFKINLVTFNKDRKDIIIYTKEKEKENNNLDDDESSSNENKNSKEIWLWLLLGLLIIMAAIIVYLLIKFFKQAKIIKKRNRLNILEDELDNDNIN